jgi:hypothetical protein
MRSTEELQMWNDPQHWRLPDASGYTSYRDNLKSKRMPIAGHWEGDGSIRPVDLYCYLKFRFGDPNGILTFLAGPHSDNLFHWDYTLQVDQGFLDIISGNRGTEIRIWSFEAIDPFAWHTLIANLKNEFARNGGGIGSVRKSLEKWQLFVNPFRRLQHTIHRMAEELEELEFIEPPDLRAGYETREEYETSIRALNTYTAQMNRVSSLGLTLRYLCPVWAESFVNLLLFVCGNAETKAPENYEKIIRAHIDIRIGELHLRCVGFSAALDIKAPAVKAMLRMMNFRNHILHGNIDPLQSAFDTVFFDRNRPIFVEEDNLALRLPRKANEWVRPEKALEDVTTVEDFIAEVMMAMESVILEDFIEIMGDSQPGWRPDTGRVGVLFPKEIAIFAGIGGEVPEDTV